MILIPTKCYIFVTDRTKIIVLEYFKYQWTQNAVDFYCWNLYNPHINETDKGV